MPRERPLQIAFATYLALAMSCGRGATPPGAGTGGSAGSAGGSVVAAAATGRLVLGTPIGGDPTWSDDGRYAAFHVRSWDYETWSHDAVDVLVDATTHAMVVLDDVKFWAFAPDHSHVVAVQRGELAVYELATGKLVGARSPIVGTPEIGDSGRIAWAERAGTAYRVHVRTIGSAEAVLVGLPAGDDPKETPELRFDHAGRVIASTPGGFRVWEHDAPDAIVAVDAPLETEPRVSDDGIAYSVEDSDTQQTFHHIDLDAGERAALPLHGSHGCGAGAMERFGQFERCGDHVYLAAARRGYCVWDTRAHRALSHIARAGDDFHCEGDLAWIGDNPPGGPYVYFSTKTGKRVRGHDPDTPPHPYDHAVPSTVRDASYDETSRLAGQLAGATHAYHQPNGGLIAGADAEGRGALWTSTGTLAWRTPASSAIATIALAANGTLVAVGAQGELWHVDLARHTLTVATIPHCAVPDPDPIGTLADGRAVVTCVLHQAPRSGRMLVLEGSATPLVTMPNYGWYVAAATGSASTTVGWLDIDGTVARTLPAGNTPFQFAPRHYGFSLTADGSRFATAEPIASRNGTPGGYRVAIRDAHGAEIATAAVPDEPRKLALSADGTRLAVVGEHKTPVRVIDASGTVVDELPAEDNNLAGQPLARPIAWDPTGAPRLAYYRTGPARVVIRDVAQHKDIETRPLVHPNEGRVREIVWSPDGRRLALLADQIATVWDGAGPPTTFALVGTGGVERFADGRVRLLGEPTAARSLLACVRGGIMTAGVDGCDAALVP